LRSKHDAAAAIVVDGELVAAAAEERFQRRKHYYGFPEQAIRYVLAEAGVRPHQVDLVARDGLSWQKTLQRLLRQPRYGPTPRLYRELIGKAIARYLRRVSDVHTTETARLAQLGLPPRYRFLEHHLGHAAYAFYASGLKDATVAVLDGRGHYLAGGFYRGRFGRLEPLAEIQAEGGSLGLFYSAVTDALGFQVGDGDGKTMGLACYGDPTVARAALEPFAPRVVGLSLRKWKEWQLDQEVVASRLYAHYHESAQLRLLIDRYGAANVAAAAQAILEDRVLTLLRNLVQRTGQRQVVAGGGIFLNVKASKRLLEEGVVEHLFIPPGPGDDGLAAGYALASYAALNQGQLPLPLRSASLGPAFSEAEIVAALAQTPDIRCERPACLPEATAALIAEGVVVGWFQGRMEFGPRALGSRSVLADPRDPGMRDRINAKLKKRDWFMPFAPSVLEEHCAEWFLHYHPSPYMNLAFTVRPPYDERVPAVVHVDRTARPQAVSRETNPLYYEVIAAFHRRTGIPLVLNTSFNRHGLPIVCTPRDALDHLLWGCIDVLAIGPFLVRRTGPVRPLQDPRALTDAEND
jgi:carbamoyltransferase